MKKDKNTFNADYASSDLKSNVTIGNIYIPKTYQINAICSNCGQLHKYTIIQGVKVEDVSCTNCGCKYLHRER